MSSLHPNDPLYVLARMLFPGRDTIITPGFGRAGQPRNKLLFFFADETIDEERTFLGDTSEEVRGKLAAWMRAEARLQIEKNMQTYQEIVAAGKAAWEKFKAEHILFSKMIRLATGLDQPTVEETQHLAECRMCQMNHDTWVNTFEIEGPVNRYEKGKE